MPGPVPPSPSDPRSPKLSTLEAGMAMAALGCIAGGTAWSSWPLLAAAVCLVTAAAWRVTRL